MVESARLSMVGTSAQCVSLLNPSARLVFASPSPSLDYGIQGSLLSGVPSCVVLRADARLSPLSAIL